jgi:hypothetical protein
MSEPALPPCPLGFTATTASFWRDDMVPPEEARRFAAHLPACPACRAELADAAALAHQLAVGRGPDPGDRVWRGVRARLIDHSMKGPIMRSRALWGSIAGVVVVALLAVLFAHVFATAASHTTTRTTGTTSSTTTAPQATATAIPTIQVSATASPTPDATSTPTPAPTAMCSGTSSPPDNFNRDIPLSNAVVVLRSAGGSDGQTVSYTDELFAVCYPNATPAQVIAYLNAHMPANGWARTTTLPSISGTCGGDSCWQRATNQPKTTRYVLFGNFVGSGSLTNFTMGSYYYTVNN